MLMNYSNDKLVETQTSADNLSLPRRETQAPPRENQVTNDDNFAAKNQEAEENPKHKSKATLLLEIARLAGVKLFHTPEGVCYGDIRVDGYRVTYKLGSNDFRDWLNHQFYLKQRKTAGSQTLQDALGVLDAMARYDGPTIAVHVRLAEHQGVIYLDLGTDDWSAIAITSDGWHITPEPPVRFRRPRGLLPLPVPARGGSISELLEVLNIKPDDRILVAAFLLYCFNPNNPKPILMLSGEQGSGKSSTAKWLKRLIDPNKAELRQPPKDGRDLMIAATNGRLLAFDNLSHVPTDLSDALCRLATGGGFATRQLYENDEETILEAVRPVILTGIEELGSRSDLLDRMVLVSLPTIFESDRKPESELEVEFERLRPQMLGALIDAVAATLKNLPRVNSDSLPRMADFARWGIAGEEALGLEPGSFMLAYQANRASANETALEASPVAQALRKLMEQKDQWEGTMKELFEALNAIAGFKAPRDREWPRNPRGLSSSLERLKPNLRRIGISVDPQKRTNKGRYVHIEKVCLQPSQPPQTSLPNLEPMPGGQFSFQCSDDPSLAPETTVTQPSFSQTDTPREFQAVSDGCDGCDAKNQAYSKMQKNWCGYQVGDSVTLGYGGGQAFVIDPSHYPELGAQPTPDTVPVYSGTTEKPKWHPALWVYN